MGLLEPDERHRRRHGPAGLKRPGPRRTKAVVVHSLDQARAAVAAAATLDVPVTLISGPGAAGYAGPGWFAEIVRLARAAHPGVAVTAILDCANQPGRALAALRMGIKDLRLGGNTRARVAAIALKRGARLDDAKYELLDLAGVDDTKYAVAAFLGGAEPHPSRRRFALPQDDVSYSHSRHPEEGRRPVSKDGGRRKNVSRRRAP